VTPETKLRIVSALQAMGHTVAMTGDGVNDAPALKKASIGVSMGITGTDVSKEVADMVLADDNFVSIVNAIEEGRIVFRNVKQTTSYLFMTNIGEAVTIVTSLFMGLPLPLLPAQILWLNLVTDGFPDIALSMEPSTSDVLAEPPRRKDAHIITKNVLFLTVLTATLMCAGTLWLFVRALEADGIGHARTVAFTAMALFQLWNVFNMRSATTSMFTLGLRSNPFVLMAVGLSLTLQLSILYVPALRGIFETHPLSFADWITIAAVAGSVFVVVEAYKVLCRRGIVPKSWL
jgi:Ca2+-transporting ATPase